MRLLIIALATVLTTALAAVALSATPTEGTLSRATPKVEWTGETTRSYFMRVLIANSALTGAPDAVPCQAPECDTFTLYVAESANLTIGADMTVPAMSDGGVTLRIRKPDNTVIVSSSGTADVSEGKPHKVPIRAAPVGKYIIEYWNNSPLSQRYSAFAELAFPPPPPAEETATATPTAEPTVTPTATPTPTPTPTPPPPALSLTAKAGKVSARKANRSRKLTATVTVSREVVAVTAMLRRGRIVLGKGALGPVKRSARLTVKLLRRLRPGVHSLSVVARDAGGPAATRTVALKVVR